MPPGRGYVRAPKRSPNYQCSQMPSRAACDRTDPDRMPLVPQQADWQLWFGEVPGDAAALLRPSACSSPSGAGDRRVIPRGEEPPYPR